MDLVLVYNVFTVFCSEFLWDYDTSIFWKFVNESTDLYSGSSTDQGNSLTLPVCM